MFYDNVIYIGIYAEEEGDNYKVYLLEYFRPPIPPIIYYLSKEALEKQGCSTLREQEVKT
jgi:hypothetical protein